MRVFGWAADESGCGAYRMLTPLRLLADHGHDTAWTTQRFGRPNVEFPPFLRAADIVVGQRIGLPRFVPVWRALREWGARLVYELDDDLFHVDVNSAAAHDLYMRPEVQKALRAAVRAADLVTVSTEPLAAVVAAECDVDPARVVVLPNLVDPAMFDVTPPARPTKRPVVGWAGGHSHEADLRDVAGDLRRFLDRNDAELHLVGADYRRLIRRDRLRHTPWAPRVADYWARVDFDVAICPLRHSIFNMSKSGCKALEMMALGIPVVASDEAPYREVIVDGVTGFLVRSGHEWVARLRDLVGDADLRTRMGAAARTHVAEHWSMRSGWQQWENAYRRLLQLDAVAA